jgi:hypothetical protein
MTDQAPVNLPVPPLTDELRRALAEADGFAFEGLEPHDYQKQAAAVRRVVARYVRADVELDVDLEDDCCRNYGRALVRWLDEDMVRAVSSVGQAPATDRTAVLSDAERTMLAYALDQAQENIWSEDGFTDEDQAAVDSLRRLADESAAVVSGRAAGETQGEAPRRGDAFEAWLKAQRDERRDDDRGQWGTLDQLLDLYRLHADTGTPLGEHVCEAPPVSPVHIGGHANAEHCPACSGTNLPYPFLCPDVPAVGGAQQPTEARP